MTIRTAAAWVFAAFTIATAAASLPATAKPGYDGLWSVVIITEKGTCDRAYRYPVRIANGSLVNEGKSPVTLNGRVGANGAVTVTVTYKDKSAKGSGRLAGQAGAGSWDGGSCSGTWEAERRG